MTHRPALVLSLFALITYHQNVKPILDEHCIECHSAGNDLDLSKFPFACTNLPDQPTIVDNMLAKVSASPALMPPGHRPKLTAEEIGVIQQWRAEGLAP